MEQSSTPQETTPDGPPQAAAPARRKRRWLRRIVVALILLLGLGYARLEWRPLDVTWAANWLASRLSAEAGLLLRARELLFTLRGVTPGLVVRGLHLESETTAGSQLAVQDVVLLFSPLRWRDGGLPQLEKVVLEDVELRLDSRRFSNSLADKSPIGVLGETLPATHPIFAIPTASSLEVRRGKVTLSEGPVFQDIHIQATLSQGGRLAIRAEGVMPGPREAVQLQAKGEGTLRNGGWEVSASLRNGHLEDLLPLLGSSVPFKSQGNPLQLDLVWSQTREGGHRIQWKSLVGAGQLLWPDLFKYPLPIGTLMARGEVEGHAETWRVGVKEFQLTSPHGSASGAFAIEDIGRSSGTILDLTAQAKGVATRFAKVYYPYAIMPPELVAWLEESLSEGEVIQAQARIRKNLTFWKPGKANPTPAEAAAEIFQITGTTSGVSILFFPGLPPVSKVSAKLLFSDHHMSAEVQKASLLHSRNIRGNVAIPDYFGDTKLNLQLTGEGDLESLWGEIFSHPKLRWDRQAGLADSRIAGGGAFRFTLGLPLSHPGDASVQGSMELRDARFALEGFEPVENIHGQLRLTRDRRLEVEVQEAHVAGLALDGKVTVADFRNPPKAHLHLQTQGSVPESVWLPRMRELFGRRFRGRGEPAFELVLDKPPKQETTHFRLKTNWQSTALQGPAGWEKEGGQPGSLTLEGDWEEGKPLVVPLLRAEFPDLTATGSATWDRDKETGSLRLAKILHAGNQGTLKVERRKNWVVDTHWQEVDLRPHLPGGEESAPEVETPRDGDEEENGTAEDLPPVKLHLTADRVILPKEPHGRSLQMDMTLGGRQFKIDQLSFAQDSAMVELLDGEMNWPEGFWVGPYQGRFRLQATDWGALLKALDYHENMEKGVGSITLDLKGNLPYGERFGRHLSGRGELNGRDGTLRKFKLLSKFLGLISLGDLPQLLSGDRPDLESKGFYFDKLHGAFQLKESRFSTDSIVLAGPSMELHLSGSIDFPREEMTMLAGLRPLQTLDKIVNTVPVVGSVVSGSRQTLFETQFEMLGSIRDPTIRVKPMSSLTPGIVRDILHVPARLLELSKQPSNEDANGEKRPLPGSGVGVDASKGE
ncbi:MAG: AsmA-like C-terminal domain-containing protein [Magnetococcales bacterium]|nr:AsmA-like C-terminal domain-containing protein [Magnetococcales bacterium]